MSKIEIPDSFEVRAIKAYAAYINSHGGMQQVNDDMSHERSNALTVAYVALCDTHEEADEATQELIYSLVPNFNY